MLFKVTSKAYYLILKKTSIPVTNAALQKWQIFQKLKPHLLKLHLPVFSMLFKLTNPIVRNPWLTMPQIQLSQSDSR